MPPLAISDCNEEGIQLYPTGPTDSSLNVHEMLSWTAQARASSSSSSSGYSWKSINSWATLESSSGSSDFGTAPERTDLTDRQIDEICRSSFKPLLWGSTGEPAPDISILSLQLSGFFARDLPHQPDEVKMFASVCLCDQKLNGWAIKARSSQFCPPTRSLKIGTCELYNPICPIKGGVVLDLEADIDGRPRFMLEVAGKAHDCCSGEEVFALCSRINVTNMFRAFAREQYRAAEQLANKGYITSDRTIPERSVWARARTRAQLRKVRASIVRFVPGLRTVRSDDATIDWTTLDQPQDDSSVPSDEDPLRWTFDTPQLRSLLARLSNMALLFHDFLLFTCPLQTPRRIATQQYCTSAPLTFGKWTISHTALHLVAPSGRTQSPADDASELKWNFQFMDQERMEKLKEGLDRTELFCMDVIWGSKGIAKTLYCVPLSDGLGAKPRKWWVCFLVDRNP